MTRGKPAATHSNQTLPTSHNGTSDGRKKRKCKKQKKTRSDFARALGDKTKALAVLRFLLVCMSKFVGVFWFFFWFFSVPLVRSHGIRSSLYSSWMPFMWRAGRA